VPTMPLHSLLFPNPERPSVDEGKSTRREPGNGNYVVAGKAGAFWFTFTLIFSPATAIASAQIRPRRRVAWRGIRTSIGGTQRRHIRGLMDRDNTTHRGTSGLLYGNFEATAPRLPRKTFRSLNLAETGFQPAITAGREAICVGGRAGFRRRKRRSGTHSAPSQFFNNTGTEGDQIPRHTTFTLEGNSRRPPGRRCRWPVL